MPNYANGNPKNIKIWILVANWISNTSQICHGFAKTNVIKFLLFQLKIFIFHDETIVKIQVDFPKTIILKTISFYTYACTNALNCIIWAWKNIVNTQINNKISRNSNLSCKIKIINKIKNHAYIFMLIFHFVTNKYSI